MDVRIVFQKPQLVWLWLSQLCSVVGDHLFTVALTWLAVSKVGSSAAYITAAGTGTALLFRLIGGVLADRWNRRVTMIRVDLLRAVIVGLLPVADSLVGLQLWHFVVVVVLVEALGTLFEPAMQASLPELCSNPLVLQTTNALMDGTQRLARVLGPGLTGVFLLVLTMPHFFTFDAITFGCSALVLMLLKPYFASPLIAERDHVPVKRSFLEEIGLSLHLLWNHKKLCWALASLGIVNVAWIAVYATGIPLLVTDRLSGDMGAYGLIVGAYGIGNVVSLFVMSMLPFRMNLLMMFIGQLLLGVGYLMLGHIASLPAAMCWTAIAAFGSPIGDLIMLSMIQTDFQSEHIGKLFSLRQLISGIGLLIGSMLAVPVFKWVSVSRGIELFAILILLVGLIGVVRFCVPQTSSRKKSEQAL